MLISANFWSEFGPPFIGPLCIVLADFIRMSQNYFIDESLSKKIAPDNRNNNRLRLDGLNILDGLVKKAFKIMHRIRYAINNIF